VPFTSVFVAAARHKNAHSLACNNELFTKETEGNMSEVWAGLIAAGIGFLGGLLASLAQSRIEDQKWLRGREDEVTRDIRSAVAEVATKLASLAHSVLWFTYNASDSEQVLSREAIESYDREVHGLIAAVVGAQVRLAAYDKQLYEAVTPFVSRIINLTEEVDEAVALQRRNAQEGRTTIIQCNQAALQFIRQYQGLWCSIFPRSRIEGGRCLCQAMRKSPSVPGVSDR
jgi:hypothetical protein